MNVQTTLIKTDKSQTGKEILNRFVKKKVTANERLHMISEAAYFRAEHRDFHGGSQEKDWLESEVEIDKLLLS